MSHRAISPRRSHYTSGRRRSPMESNILDRSLGKAAVGAVPDFAKRIEGQAKRMCSPKTGPAFLDLDHTRKDSR
jgi:hypothetical protein